MPITSTSPPPPFHAGLGVTQSSGMPKWILANDGLRALGAYRHGDRLHPDELLDALDVSAGVFPPPLLFSPVAPPPPPPPPPPLPPPGARPGRRVGGGVAHPPSLWALVCRGGGGR